MAQARGQQRPDGPVNLAADEGGFLRGPPLALEKAAGDLALGSVETVTVTSTIVSP